MLHSVKFTSPVASLWLGGLGGRGGGGIATAVFLQTRLLIAINQRGILRKEHKGFSFLGFALYGCITKITKCCIWRAKFIPCTGCLFLLVLCRARRYLPAALQCFTMCSNQVLEDVIETLFCFPLHSTAEMVSLHSKCHKSGCNAVPWNCLRMQAPLSSDQSWRLPLGNRCPLPLPFWWKMPSTTTLTCVYKVLLVETYFIDRC